MLILLVPGVGMGGGAAAVAPSIAAYVTAAARLDGTSYLYHFPLNNLQASAAPGVSDDGTAGYAPGSMWVDKTGEDAYICIRSTTGAAVWKQVTA